MTLSMGSRSRWGGRLVPTHRRTRPTLRSCGRRGRTRARRWVSSRPHQRGLRRCCSSGACIATGACIAAEGCPLRSHNFIGFNTVSNILRYLYGKPPHDNRKCGCRCVHSNECGRFVAPYAAPAALASFVAKATARQSTLLSGYAVLEQPSLASRTLFYL